MISLPVEIESLIAGRNSNVYLYWAEAVETLSQMKDACVDCIFIDPPYSTGNDKDKTPEYTVSEYMSTRNWTNFYANWDGKVSPDFTRDWLREAKRVLKPAGSMWTCGSFHNIPITGVMMEYLKWYTIQWVPWIIPNAMPHLRGMKMGNANQTLIWSRPQEAPVHFYNYRRAKLWGNGKNLRDFWRVDYELPEEWDGFWASLNSVFVVNNSVQAVNEMPELKEFKAKKPYKLIARALDISLPDDRDTVVLDFFAGSGTTGVVCQRINEFIPEERKYPIDCMLIERSRQNISRFIEPRLKVIGLAGPGGTE